MYDNPIPEVSLVHPPEPPRNSRGLWPVYILLALILAVYAGVALYDAYQQYQVDDATSQRVRLIPHDITDMVGAWKVRTDFRAFMIRLDRIASESLAREKKAAARRSCLETKQYAIDIIEWQEQKRKESNAPNRLDMRRAAWDQFQKEAALHCE